MYVGDEEFRVCFADKSTHFHSPLGICQALPSTCALSHVIPKPIYGKQEGAEVGYNPNKRGRPSHCYHSYLIANLRLVLGVDVTSGTESNSPYSLPGLLEILDDLPAAMRPFLVRADRGYGNDAMMSALEERGQDYLLKLPMRKRAKELVAKLSTESGWSDVGQGWYGKSSELQLMGWSRKRRVVVMRRRRKSPDDVALPAQTAEGDQLLLGLSEVVTTHPFTRPVHIPRLCQRHFRQAQFEWQRVDCIQLLSQNRGNSISGTMPVHRILSGSTPRP